MADTGAPVGEPRPLLAFPAALTGSIPRGDGSPFRPVQRPPPRQQGVRLAPQFSTLQEALESGRAQLTEATAAPDPELVAVFDLAGSVPSFLRAADGVPGLDFLSELQEDLVEPDDDFHYDAHGLPATDRVPASLYMVMTDARAVVELVRLFEIWQQDPRVTFDQPLNPLKEVFALLRSIRRWGPEDRVRETGLLERWEEDVEVAGPQGVSRVEIELWFRSDPARRRSSEDEVKAIVADAGGTVVAVGERPEIAYHAILADLPMSEVQHVLDEGLGAIALLTTESVMMVSPSRPMAVPTFDPEAGAPLAFDPAAPEGPPRIALLDGVPMANHVALEGRLIVDDPDDHESRYGLAQRRHASAMASLIVHGDLADPGAATPHPIYLRPIFEPHAFATRLEVAPPDVLLVDLIHRAVRRMFEGDGGGPPAAQSARILCLAIGDPARVFVRRLSPLARLLDWLCHEYNVVVVVSGGNHADTSLQVDADSLADQGSAEAAASKALFDQARQRRLLSPAEAVNVLTAGALHEDASGTDLPDTVRDVIPAGLPASYSPVGFGYRRSVKPEVLLPGGRQVFRAPPPGAEGEIRIEPAEVPASGIGLGAASPGLAGERDGVAYSCGTSNAAALGARALGSILEVLEAARHEEGEAPFPGPQYHPVLVKTLLVHAAGWHEGLPQMRDLLGLTGQEIRRDITRLFGYGPVRSDRIASADRVRVVLLGAGSIGKDQRHSFSFPLPSILSNSTDWRRLTITLGWFSPINVRSQQYRMARLQFAPAQDALRVVPVEADAKAIFKGTVQHQIFEGSRAAGFVPGSSLAIDVDCRVDAGALPAPVRYGIAASIEVASSVLVDLHADVRTQLRAAVRTRARAQIASG